MTRIIKRPVFILHGDSCLCKSFLAAKTGLTVYETDVSTILPDSISADIIVIGNRSKFTMQDVLPKIYMRDCCKLIDVNFEEIK